MAKSKHVRKGVHVSDWDDHWVGWYSVAREIRQDFGNVEEIAKSRGVSVDVVAEELNNLLHEKREQRFAEIHSKVADLDQEAVIRNNHLDSVISVLQKADRILTNLPVEVFLNDEATLPASAWNDGKNVTFNSAKITKFDDETLPEVMGLNYHEVAHLLYTPRAGSVLGKWVSETHTTMKRNKYEKWWDYSGEQAVLLDEPIISFSDEYEAVMPVNRKRQPAFNILEDCRIEAFLVEKYPSVRAFLINIIGDHVIGDAEHLGGAFALIAGRKYLPIELRQLSAYYSVKELGLEKTKQIYSIVSEYRTLAFPRDVERAKELIEEFTKFVPDPDDFGNYGYGDNCSGRAPMRNGRPASGAEQNQIADAIKGQLDDLEPTIGSEAGTNTGEIDPDHAHFNVTSEEVAEKLNEVAKTAKEDKELRSKVRDATRAIAKSTSTTSILDKQASGKQEPTSADIIASRLFSQELERIRIESDPAWLTELPTGKLNVRRAMTADVNEINSLFDRWRTGNDDYDIEASILIDRSGSMYADIGSACRSAWVIKRAIEKINGKVTVMTFNDVSRTIYRADERAEASVIRVAESSGGTSPKYALLETERIMSNSVATTKLMFLLTDGGFEKYNDQIIERLNNLGVHTNVVFLGSGDWVTSMLNNPSSVESATHKAKNFTAISKPKDLVKVAKTVVRSVLGGKR